MKRSSSIDLSDIKENELEKTSSFTDLMSRSQRKAHEKSKKNVVKNEIKEVKQESPNEFSISTDKAKLRIKVNDGSNTNDTNDKNATNNKQEKKEIKYEYLNEDLDEKKAKIGLSIIGGLLTIGSIGYYLYLILCTDILLRKKFFIIESVIIIFIIFSICVNSIGNKKISKVFLLFAYLFIILFIALNILIKLNYIK